jgi:hypothetical protein
LTLMASDGCWLVLQAWMDKHGLGTEVMTAAEAQRKRELAKEKREAMMQQYVREAIEAESFEDLSDERAKEEVQKEEL